MLARLWKLGETAILTQKATSWRGQHIELVVENGAGVVLAFGEDNARMLGYAPHDGATVPPTLRHR